MENQIRSTLFSSGAALASSMPDDVCFPLADLCQALPSVQGPEKHCCVPFHAPGRYVASLGVKRFASDQVFTVPFPKTSSAGTFSPRRVRVKGKIIFFGNEDQQEAKGDRKLDQLNTTL